MDIFRNTANKLKIDGALTEREMLIIHHYDNQQKQFQDVVDDNAFKLNELYYQLRFIINYISLVNLQCAAKEEKSAFTLHHLLYHDSGLQNIEEMLQIASGTVNEVGGQLLESSRDEVASDE